MDKKNTTLIQGINLIKELGLEGLSEEKKTELVENMSKLLWKRVFLAIVDRLSEDEAGELSNLLERDNYKEADEYLAKKIPDSIEIFKKEVQLFQKEVVEKSGKNN